MYLAGLAGVVRFGIQQNDSTGAVQSGACYPGCSPSNIAACKPMSFPSQGAFNSYATANGEIPQMLGAAIPDSAEWNYLRSLAFSRCASDTQSVPAPPQTPYIPPTIIASPTEQTPITTIFKPLPTVPTGIQIPSVTYNPGAGPVINVPGPPPGTDYTPYILGGIALLALM